MADDPPKRTPPKGVQIRPISEKTPTGMYRDHGRPKSRSDQDTWDDDTPPSTDPTLYRAIRELRSEVKDQADELGDVKTQVAVVQVRVDNTQEMVKQINDKQDYQNDSLIKISTQLAIMGEDRDRHLRTTNTRMIAETTTKETLAEGVLAEQRAGAEFKRKLWLQIATGVFSSAVITAIITALVTRGC